MIGQNTNIDAFSKINWFLMAIALVMTGFVYLLYIFNNDFLLTPNLASDILLGHEIFSQKSLIPAGWFFDDSLNVFGVPFFCAFFSFFGATLLTSYRLAVILMLLFELFALAYMTRSLKFSKTSVFLAFLIFFGVRSFVSGTYSGMGFCLFGGYYVMFFLVIGYLTEKMRGNEGKLEKILKFLIPIFSFLLGFEGFTILLVLFLPLMLLFLVPILRPFEKLDFSKQSVFWEVLLWFGLSLIGYLILLFVIVPRGFGPEIPYTRYMMGFFYAVAGNIPSLLPSFIDETPLNAIKGRALVFTLNSMAAFAFLVFLFYLLYVFKTVLKKMDQLFVLPVRLLLTSLTLTLCLTLLFVVLAKFTIFFYFYILMVFIIVIYENYLENENIRLAKLLVFATAVLVILTSSANFKDFIRLSEENPARAVIQHSKTVEKIAKDFGISRMYAPLPDASPLEVLLSGNIKVGSLTSDLRPYVIGTSAERFAPSLTGERVAFVLPLKGKDIESYRKVEADPLLQLAKERVRIDDKTTPVDVFLFDKNPFTFSGRLAVFPELEGNLKDDESGPLQTFESEENDGKIIDNDALESQNNDSFIKY